MNMGSSLRDQVRAIVAEFDTPLPKGDAGIKEGIRRWGEIKHKFDALAPATRTESEEEVRPHPQRLLFRIYSG